MVKTSVTCAPQGMEIQVQKLTSRTFSVVTCNIYEIQSQSVCRCCFSERHCAMMPGAYIEALDRASQLLGIVLVKHTAEKRDIVSR